MRHGHGFRKLNVGSEHRKALMRNLSTQLILRDRIITTTAKAKELRKYIEPIITKAKKGTPHSYNLVKGQIFLHNLVLPQLFGVLGQRYKNRSGGYCRLSRIGLNDKSEDECLVELVDSPMEFTKSYRLKLLEKYKDQIYRIKNMGQKKKLANGDLLDVQKPYSYVYPSQKRIQMLNDQDNHPSLKDEVVKKLTEIIEKYQRLLKSRKIEYHSSVTLTEKGPIYEGELLKVSPPALMDGNLLKKQKIVFHEKIIPSESLRLRKHLFRRGISENGKPSLKDLMNQSIKKEALENCERYLKGNDTVDEQTLIQETKRLQELKGFKNYNVKISTVERVVLEAKPSNSKYSEKLIDMTEEAEELLEKEKKEKEDKASRKTIIGKHGRNKHLR
eukprot:NODE_29_length_33183_cov_0.333666.p4 type:complete len:388 gc:universal NODE_29_length_33183_cov_0.333666:9934-11097(+)